VRQDCFIVNVQDLIEILTNAEVDPTYYHLHGSSEEGLCILAEGQTWKVFLSERAARYEECAFDTEDDACVYFLKRIFQLWRKT
jgi:hypothetical protein